MSHREKIISTIGSVIILTIFIYLTINLYVAVAAFILGIIFTLLVVSKTKRKVNKKSLQTFRITNKLNLSKRPRVVVSFSTIPSRTKYIKNVLQKLKNQTLQPDMVYICIPYYSKRLKTKYILSENIDFNDNITISRTDDYGPATKLLGCLNYENDPNTAIITIDDDQNYHPDTIKTLVSYSIYFPDKVCAFRTLTQDLYGTYCPEKSNITNPDAYYVEGFAGILYRRKFISDDMFEYFHNLSKNCFVSDDLVISSWMEINGIDRLKICDYQNVDTDEIIDSNNALHREKRDLVYSGCLKEMKILIYRKESSKLLKIFKNIMEYNNILYSVFFGTLLGAVREKDFIETDHDIDVMIFEQDLPKYLTLREQFEKAGIRMNYTDNIYRLEFSKRYVNSYIDVFVYRNKNGVFKDISKENRKRWPHYEYEADDLFPLKDYYIGDIKIKGPNEAEKILEQTYGDWQTPRDTDEYVPVE